MKQLSIELTPHFEDMLKSKVSSGRYESASEVVREGLRLLEERDEERAALDNVRREIEIGWQQSNEGAVVDGPGVFAEIRRMSKSRRAGHEGAAMNSLDFELTAGARLDLIETWNFLAETESLDIADRVLADIEAGVERLVESPGLGHKRRDLTKRPLLFYAVGWYLIVYRRKGKPLRIMRVLHGARDVKSILQQ